MIAALPTAARAGFSWDRKPEPSWVEELHHFAPPNGKVPWLELAWMAGWPYEPVGRFVIYELHPNVEKVAQSAIGATLLEGLRGPSPRSKAMGEWASDPDIPQSLGGKRWVSYSPVSYTQWLLYRKHKAIPLLCWIIQGELGGHSWRLTDAERRILAEGDLYASGISPDLSDPQEYELMVRQQMGRLKDTPLPGDLPYAPFDLRVLNQLQVRDKLRHWRRALAWQDRQKRENAIQLVREQRTEEQRDVRLLMDRWLRAQVEQFVEVTEDFWRAADLPRGDPAYNNRPGETDEDVERAFIEE